MKKFIYSVMALAIVMSSCSRVEDPLPAAENAGGKTRVKLEVTVSGNNTRADTIEDTADEAKISNLQVFVFKDGKIDAYSSGSSATVSMDVAAGNAEIHALVNAPDLSSVKTLQEYLVRESLLKDNGSDKFVMNGSTIKNLSSNSTVTIEVNRLASRVRINQITRRFSSGLSSLDASAFEITRLYLTNVVGNLKYDLSEASPLLWFNTTMIDRTLPLCCTVLTPAATLAQDRSYTTPQSLYCYPNSTALSDTYANMTRIVVECKIDGSYYTYPIVLTGGVQSNKSYEINELVITRLGNPSDGDDEIDDGEDDPILNVGTTVQIDVKDWGLCLVGDNGVVTI